MEIQKFMEIQKLMENQKFMEKSRNVKDNFQSQDLEQERIHFWLERSRL